MAQPKFKIGDKIIPCTKYAEDKFWGQTLYLIKGFYDSAELRYEIVEFDNDTYDSGSCMIPYVSFIDSNFVEYNDLTRILYSNIKENNEK